MMKSIRLNPIIPMLLLACSGRAAEQRSDFAVGRAYYAQGEFKRAASHFHLALRANPNDAEFCYWIGMSYQGLANIATPFGGGYYSKARIYLTKAMELAPNRPDYRRELFDFLLDSAPSSPAGLRQATGILQMVPESDPDYRYMRRRLENETRATASAEARFGRLFMAIPRAAYRMGELPGSAVSRRAEPAPPTLSSR